MDAEKINRYALSYLFANTRLAVLRLDSELKVLEANQGCTRILGYPDEELVGRNLYELVVIDPEGTVEEMLEGERIEGELLKIRTAFEREATLYVFLFRDDEGALLIGEAMQAGNRQDSEITLELHKKAFSLAKTSEDLRRRNAYLELANRRMRESQVTDPITGLYKRNHLERLLRAEYERARRHHGDLSFMLVSVDGLRAFRELRGPEAATRVLRGVARVLDARKRVFDILGHFDADSFYLVLPHTSMEGARDLGERLLEMLRNREIQAGDYPFRIFLSIGIATYNNRRYPMRSHEELIHAAADSLMRAQVAGGDRVKLVEATPTNLRVVP